MRFFISILFMVFICIGQVFPKSVHYADVEYQDVVAKSREMLEQHASFHEVNDELATRILERFLAELDPLKIYFLQSEIEEWLHPSPLILQEVQIGFLNGSFPIFKKILNDFSIALKRNETLEKLAGTYPKSDYVREKYLKNNQWASDIEQLLIRIRMVQVLEESVLSRFEPDMRQKALERFEKRKKMAHELLFSSDRLEREKVISTMLLKAFSQALDSQSVYFTPVEANQFVIAVQQKLFGIGVLFRDDIDGFTVLQLVEGGPAECQGELKINDKVIAVDNEPIIGVDLYEVVELIRGKENTPVTLRIVRDVGNSGVSQKESKDITIQRGAVIVRDSRLEAKILPSAAGAIGYLHLSSFYQDEETSSGADMRKALEGMMSKQSLNGVVLDLRGNPGGILQQAVEVCGLFMDNSLICSVKEGDSYYPFWNLMTKKTWNGPLVVLVDRTSASASEIVAQTLQDWGRAVIIGDDRTFGKGSFQMLSFPADNTQVINPKGEFKISKGRYYTTSGKSPQLIGVLSDVEVCSPYRFLEIGEMYSSYPLSNERIPSYFEEVYVPANEPEKSLSLKDKIKNFFSRTFSSFSEKMQKRENLSLYVIPSLRARSMERLQKRESYQIYLESLQKNMADLGDQEEEAKKKDQEDFACQEAVLVLEDLIQMGATKEIQIVTKKAA